MDRKPTDHMKLLDIEDRNQKKRKWRNIIAYMCLSWSIFCWEVKAGGIELSLYGHRQSGMANTGVGLALDASSSFINPGALSFIYRNHIQFGASVMLAKVSFLAQTPSVYSEENEPSTIHTPIYFHTSWRLNNSRLVWGLSLTNPFGYNLSWPDEWKGRFIIQEAATRAYYIQGTMSYQVNDQLGLGVGLMYGIGNMLERRALPVISSDQTEGRAELSGGGTGFGYQVGIYYRANYYLTIGLTYRSRINIDIEEGKAVFEVPISLESEYPNSNFSSVLRFPQVINLGFGYHPRDNIVIGMDFSFTGWKIVDTLSIDYETNSKIIRDEDIPQNFSNTFSIRFGGEYEWKEKYFFRGGWYYTSSPVPSGFLSPQLPDADKLGLSVGFGLQASKGIEVDISYLYEFTGERTDVLEEAGFGGKYETAIPILGLGMTYTF